MYKKLALVIAGKKIPNHIPNLIEKFQRKFFPRMKDKILQLDQIMI
jgi:hypothetical protein